MHAIQNVGIKVGAQIMDIEEMKIVDREPTDFDDRLGRLAETNKAQMHKAMGLYNQMGETFLSKKQKHKMETSKPQL